MTDVFMFPGKNTYPQSKSLLSEASIKKNGLYFKKLGFLSMDERVSFR